MKANPVRIEALWAAARARRTRDGPWLLSDYSFADVFYAPVATRIVTYGLEVGPEARAYVEAHIEHPAFRDWRAAALADPRRLPSGGDGLPTRPWPA